MRLPAPAILGPSLLVLAGLLYLSAAAVPRISDGSEDLRTVFHVMNDETVILERTWQMVDRGDINPGIAVYPGLYPYSVALVKLSSPSNSVKKMVERTRWLSLVTTIVALLVPCVLFALLAESWWVAAIFTFFLAIHPETVLFAARVHPDAFLLLFDHAALGCLGLALAKDRRFLWAATAFAGLSAGTKIIGCFIMVSIAAFIIWDRRKEPREMLRQLALHSFLFLLVFGITTPNLIRYPVSTLQGFLVQHDRNLAPKTSLLDWWSTFVGDRGLGYSGVAVTVFGVGLLLYRRIRARTLDGLALVLGFGLFYLCFILVTVRLTLPRYAAPGLWPLLFVGLTQLRPSLWRWKPAPVLASFALVALFVAVDWPAQQAAIRFEAGRLERTMTPQMLALGRKLESISLHRPGDVVSSTYVWVPSSVPWWYVWTLDELTLPGSFAAIVVDPPLAKGEAHRKLVGGELGYVATATIGRYIVYEPIAAPPP